MLPHAAVAGCLLVALVGAALAAPTVRVSPSALPGGDGSEERPYASLSEARDAVRAMDRSAGAVVELAEGVYRLSEPLVLTEADSGSPGAPVVYRSAAGARATVTGGRAVTGFAPVTAPEVRDRLPEEARGRVVCADLRAQGITEYGAAEGGGLFVYFDGRPLTVARWPNEGFTRITGLVGGNPVDVRGTIGDLDGNFHYEGDRPSRWIGEPDLWLHGYWFWDWADQRHPVDSIDPETRTIRLRPPYHTYGYRVGQWFYAFNAIAEIDAPGEWVLDRQNGLLYLWPPAPLEGAEVVVSVAEGLFALRGASNVSLEGLDLEVTRGTAVTIEGGAECRVAGCRLRNLGGLGVTVAGGERHGVVGCDIAQTHRGGIDMWGGDRRSLTPAGHYATNNHIHDYGRWWRMYTPGISLNGVGLRAQRNLIHDAPHMAIGFGGNDHLIEGNEIHHVCLESNDAGAMYTGRDWTMCGTVVRGNYLHDIRGFEDRGCVGVYLDDMSGSAEIVGNVFERVTSAAFIGGGRNVTIANNLFLDCDPAVHVDDRAMNWAAYHVGTTMTERLEAMPYRESPWRERYPQLLTILEDEPAAPKGNVVARNVCVGGRFDGIYAGARPYVRLEDNLVDVDPLFVDRSGGDLRFSPESPAWSIGFEPIDFGAIGLQVDEWRHALPAREPVAEPRGRAFAGTLSVSLASSGATIHYTLEGSEPTVSSPLYEGPIALEESAVLRAAAWSDEADDATRSATLEERYERADLAGEGVPLSMLVPESARAYAGLKRDANMAGGPVRLGGAAFARGLVMHPEEGPDGGRAEAVFRLDGGLERATRLTAVVGIEDSMARDGKGSVSFRVEALRGGTWTVVFESPVLRGAETRTIEVPIAGAEALRLTTTDGGDNIHCDHATWADVRLR